MEMDVERQNGLITAITYHISKKNNIELLGNLTAISLFHGRNFAGNVCNIPVFRMSTGQHPFYVQEIKIPTINYYDIDGQKLRQIIENFEDALILTYRSEKNEGLLYFLPPAIKKEDGTIDFYARRDCFLPDLKLLNEPEGFKKKRYLELSDIIDSSVQE